MPASAVRKALAAATATAIGAVLLSGCSTGSNVSSPPPEASSTGITTTCPTPEAGANSKDTASYRMVVSSSSPEMMATQQQVDAQGLTKGELLVGGMAMGSKEDAKANRHVEVAICNLATGETVTGADVKMSIVTGGSTPDMMVMEMRGLDEPVTESHYGSNTVVPGTAYRMRVTLNGENAEFPMAASH